MEKNSKDQFLRKIEQHNRNIPKTIFEAKPQDYLLKSQTFGISNDRISKQFTAIGKDHILYYCSSMLVIKNIDKNTSHFLYKEGRLKNVSAISSASKEPEGKQLMIAAGEHSFGDNQKAIITIITIVDKKEDWKVISTHHKEQIEYLQFNHNKTKIGCLSIASDHIYFSLYNIEKGSLVVSSSFKFNDVKRFTMDMNTDKSMYLYGDGLLKLYEFNITEKCLKELGTNLLTKENKQTKFVDHIWQPGNTHKQSQSLIMISSSKIFIIKNQSILRTIVFDIERTKIKSWNSLRLDHSKDPEEEIQMIDPQQIRLSQKFQLKCFIKDDKQKKGNDLIMGASNGLIIFYDLPTGEFNAYQILSNQQIVSLSSNLNRTVIASVSRDYYDKRLSFNLIKPQMLDTDDPPFRCFFGQGYHFNKIISLSVASGRQLFATGSIDKNIRVWNYLTKQSIAFGSYKQSPVSIAIHPSGFWLAIAFPTQIQMYSILSNSLCLLKSARNLDEVKSIQFSNKGHFLISNQTYSLKLYDPYTFRVISIYEMDDGRTSLLSYAINSTDTRIVAVYQNGNVYTWEIVEGDHELPFKCSHTEPLGYDFMILDENYFIGTNSAKYLSLYKSDCSTLINEFPVMDCSVTSIVLSKQLSILFVGTSLGTIRMYTWPINESSCPFQLIENSHNKVRLILPYCYQSVVHNSSITALGLSEDCKYLFSGFDNGGVFMLEIKGLKTQQQTNEKNKQLLVQVKEERRKIKQATTNLFLICDSKMKDKNDQLRRMELQLEKIEQTIEKEKIGREKHLQRMISEKLEEYSNVIVKEKQTQNKTLLVQKQQINKLQSDYSTTKNLFEKNTTSHISNYQKGKDYQIKRRENLKLEIKNLKNQYIAKLDELLSKHKLKLQDIKAHYKEIGNKLEQQYKGILGEAQQKFSLKQINAKQDDLQFGNNKDKINNLNRTIDELKHTYAILENENMSNQVQDENVQTQFSNMFEKHNACRLKNIRLREQILKTEHQLNERIQIVRNKQLTYKEASECQTTLENYKSMIDNRVLELQRKKKEIFEKTKEKQSELEVLFNELISSTNLNEKKKFELKKQESYKENLEQNVRRSEIQIFFGIKRLKSYQQFIENILSSKQSKINIHSKIHDFLENPLPEDLQMVGYLEKTLISHKDMKQIYKLKEQKGNQQNNILEHEGKVLTKKFNLMKFTCKKMKDTHETNITYTLKQNQKLVEQCNLLRYENQCYQKQIRKAEKFINVAVEEQKKMSSKIKDSEKLKDVEKRIIANQQSLKEQTFKLNEIREFISTIKKQKQF